MYPQKAPNNQNSLNKHNRAGSILLPDFKTAQQATATNIKWETLNNKCAPETDTHIYVNWYFKINFYSVSRDFCQSVCLCTTCIQCSRVQKTIRSPRPEVADGCEPPCECWESDSGPLEEKPLLLTAEPSLQLPRWLLRWYQEHTWTKGCHLRKRFWKNWLLTCRRMRLDLSSQTVCKILSHNKLKT